MVMEPRRNPNKPGRELVVNYDSRFPAIPGFTPNYSYYVRFLEKDNSAGNHYHEKKQEIFIPITGEFNILLEDIQNKERENFAIRSENHEMFYIPSMIAHRVTARDEGSVLLVLATSANTEGDEYPYEFK